MFGAREQARSYVDSIFHPQIFTEQQIAEVPGYAADYGIRSFKFYMSGMPGIVKSVTDDVLLRQSPISWSVFDSARYVK